MSEIIPVSGDFANQVGPARSGSCLSHTLHIPFQIPGLSSLLYLQSCSLGKQQEASKGLGHRPTRNTMRSCLYVTIHRSPKDEKKHYKLYKGNLHSGE